MNTASPQEHEAFLANYHRYVLRRLNPIRLRFRSLFEEWRAPDYWKAHRSPPLPIPSPVLAGDVAIKRPEAVVDKIMRNPEQFPHGLSMKSVKQMGDVLRGRVVVTVLPDLAFIDSEIRARSELRLWPERPPRVFLDAVDIELAGLSTAAFDTVPSDRGTAALVYWLCLGDEVPDAQPLQLQVVTVTQRAWADVQRRLGYHPKKGPRDDMRDWANELSSEQQHIERRLTEWHNAVSVGQRDAQLDDDATLSAENLPVLLDRVGVTCSEVELDGMLKVLASRGVERVRDLRQRTNGEVVEGIRDVYLEEVGWPPSSFEIVATVAMLGPTPSNEELSQAVRLNYKYLTQWEATVRESSTARDELAPLWPRRSLPSRLLRKR